MTHVITFVSDRFDPASETPNPINPIAGQSVLVWLRAALQGEYRVTEPDTEDWGWYIEAQGADGAYLVGASAEADAPAAQVEWTLQVHRHRSLSDKVLGRNKMLADDPLVNRIEAILRADSRIEQISVTRDT